MQTQEAAMPVIRRYELKPSGTEGCFSGGLATPSHGAREVSVIRQRVAPGAANPQHLHDREEVMVQLAGSVTVTVEDESVELSPGDTLIVPAGKVHWIANTGEADAEWLIVAPTGVEYRALDGQTRTPAWSL